MSFPARLSELTVDWLNQVFDTKGLLGAGRIVAFNAVPASAQGGTSSVYVLTLTYDPPAENAPGRALAKFSAENQEVRDAVRDHRLYQREIAFYTHYGLDPGIQTPACYAADYEERSNTCVLLLQYIEEARSRAVHEGGPEDIEAAVQCLAPFHARWWGREAASRVIESYDALPVLEKRMEQAARAFARIKEGGHRGACGETSFALLDFWLAHAHALARYSRSRPQTICHGSFHRGQILFPDRGARLPWVIDWQSVSSHIGAHDLARIIVSGLFPAQRRRHERRLLALYHALLTEGGVRGYPLEQLFDDYRLAIVGLVVFHSLILADYPVEVVARHWKERTPFWEMLFRWPGDAAQEWDVLGWLETHIPPSRGTP
jgi:aminoglycoside/choline kinase family phosphotransferase